MDCSPPGSSVHRILPARILESIAMPSSRGIFLTQGSNSSLPHCRQILYRLSHHACMHAKSLQSCSALCNPMDHSPPDSSVHGILQSRILECAAISFSNQEKIYTYIFPLKVRVIPCSYDQSFKLASTSTV